MERGSAEYIGEGIGVLCCALCFVGWVTQSKDDWSFVQAGHGLENIVGEKRAGASHAWKMGKETQGYFNDSSASNDIIMTFCLIKK